MAKWADYIITGVWYGDDQITHVFLHPDNGESHMAVGSKKTRQQVVSLVQAVTRLSLENGPIHRSRGPQA